MTDTATATPSSKPAEDPRSELLIGGRWTSTSATIVVYDPATGEPIGTVADGGPDDGLRALDAADAAQSAWELMPDAERSHLFRAAEERLVADRERIARYAVLESGKPLAQAQSEVDAAIGYWRWYGGQIGLHPGMHAPSTDGQFTVLTNRKPIGPSLLISPWNFPALTPLRKMAAALAAGCTVVVKSASLTPFTVALMVDAIVGAGFPPGVVNLIHTSRSSALSQALMDDRRLRKVSFTGSTEVGSALIRQSARNIVSMSMELGGNSGFIVLDDADLDQAVEGALVAKFRNSGQVCIAANRFILHSQIADKFLERFAARTAELRVGHGLEPGTDLGPVITAGERDRILDSLARSRAAGSSIVLGGTALEQPGSFLAPTVVAASTLEDPLARQEIFGPVAVAYRVDSAEDAIAFANRSEYGLAAYLYTGDVSRGLAVARRLESGVVGLNRVGITDPIAPFGGVKASGLGREGGYDSILEFTEEQYIALAAPEAIR